MTPAQLQKAWTDLRRLRAEWAAAEARAAGLKLEAVEAKARAAQARNSVLDAEAEKMLGGKPTLPKQLDPDEVEERGKVAERAAAKIAATLPGIAEQCAVAKAALVNAVLADTLAATERAQAEALEIVAQLGGPLADMLARERLRNTILGGERFTFDRGAIDPGRLFSAAIVMRKFLEALPARMVPAGMTFAALNAEAERRATAMLAGLEKVR